MAYSQTRTTTFTITDIGRVVDCFGAVNDQIAHYAIVHVASGVRPHGRA